MTLNSKESQLLQAAHYGSMGGLSIALKNKDKIDINCQDDAGLTALHWCVKNHKEPLVEMLLDSGASPNVKDGKGDTALHYAVELKAVKIQRLLIKYGADIYLVGSRGKSAKELANEDRTSKN